MTLYNSIIDFFPFIYLQCSDWILLPKPIVENPRSKCPVFSIIRMGFGWFFGLVWFHIGTIGPSNRSWLLVLLDCMMKTLKTPILHNRSFKGPIICKIYKCFLIINCVSELPEKRKHTLNNRSSGVCKGLFGDVFDNTLPFVFLSCTVTD